MNNQRDTRNSKFLDRILIVSGIVAPVVLLLSVLISGNLYPGYSHLSQAISELGTQDVPHNAILNYVGLVPSGILTFLFSLAMFRNLKGGPALLISSVCVALVGISRIAAGIFPCDPGCMPIITIIGRFHFIFGSLALFAGSVAPLAMGFHLRSSHSRALYLSSLILGSAAFLLFLALVSEVWLATIGGIQRLLLILTYGWIILVAINMGAFGKKITVLEES